MTINAFKHLEDLLIKNIRNFIVNFKTKEISSKIRNHN